MTGIRATISGSFTRHLEQIQRDVVEITRRGVRVLSPSLPYVVEAVDGFVFVASDRHRSIRLVQDRHLAAIGASNFLWLVCPDGYVGQSASLELGFAVALGIPVYSQSKPADITLRQYVRSVSSISEALSQPDAAVHSEACLLVDPQGATDIASSALSNVRQLLLSRNDVAQSWGLPSRLGREIERIRGAVALPSKV